MDSLVTQAENPDNYCHFKIDVPANIIQWRVMLIILTFEKMESS